MQRGRPLIERMTLGELGAEVVSILGPRAAAELLAAITSPQADRAELIGRLTVRDDALWLADLLTELEVDERARLQLAEGLRQAFVAD
jgi:hypothetical protein